MNDQEAMAAAIEAGAAVRYVTSPNPWVGAVAVAADGQVSVGATSPPGGPHAERHALDGLGDNAAGSTLYTTLEPCPHHGRTGPCTDAIIAAGVARVVVGVIDPDPQVAGAGIRQLQSAAIDVVVEDPGGAIARQLEPYLHHRRYGRPWVVLKLAASLDGRTAAPDGSSRWITGPEARRDAHRLRALSDAIVVGAGTVRADDPSLTVRDWEPPDGVVGPILSPRRIVLGSVDDAARVNPCTRWTGPLPELLDDLGANGVLQVMVEGGASVAGEFHRQGLVDQYVVYLAPALFGGSDGVSLFGGAGAATINDVWRGSIDSVGLLGADLRVDLRRAQ